MLVSARDLLASTRARYCIGESAIANLDAALQIHCGLEGAEFGRDKLCALLYEDVGVEMPEECGNALPGPSIEQLALVVRSVAPRDWSVRLELGVSPHDATTERVVRVRPLFDASS